MACSAGAMGPPPPGVSRGAERAPAGLCGSPPSHEPPVRAAGGVGCSRSELVMLIGRRQPFMLRSYHPEHTGSHQNSEVKLDWAGLVLC